jgi:PAS domain S-box-containing protein
LREVCEFNGTSGGNYDFATRPAGRSSQRFSYFPPVLGRPPSWVMGNLLSRPRPGTSLLRAVLAGALLVLGLLLWLISKALVSEVHFTWSIISSLVIAAVAVLMGTAFFVHRRDGVPQKTEEVLQHDQMQLDGPPEEIEEPEMEARLQRWANASFTVAVMLTVLLSLLSWYGAQQAAKTAAWVAHSHEVMTELESALRHSLDMETAGRGFAETGSVQFLAPYESGRPAVVQDLHALRVLLVTPDQLERLNVLEEQANNQVEDVEAIVASRQNMGTMPTVALFEHGKHDMDAMRITVEQMEVAERGLLALRTQRARAAQHSSSVVIALGSVLGVIFLSIAGMTVSREIGVSARARARVKALNTTLEQRVEQRTAALEESEAKLGASEQMFRTLLDGVKDYAVYMLDGEGRVVTWNSGAARIHGYQAEEIIGKHVSCFYVALDLERHRPSEALHQAATTGHFEEHGWRVRKDGSSFWANVVIAPLHDGNGSLSGYSKVVRDITEHKQAEDKLRSHAALLDQASDAIMVRDLESRVIFMNRAAQQMYGLSTEEASGRVSHELLQTRFPIPLTAIELALATKGDWEGELRHTTRQGVEVVVASRWTLQRDDQGAPTAILEINRDITERKHAEEMRERLAAIVDSSEDAIISKTLDGTITAWNRGAEKVFGYPAEEIVGKPMLVLLPPERVNEEPDILARIRRGESVEHFETVRVRKDGTNIDVSVTISPIRDANGVTVGASKIARDISERKKAEEQLARSAMEMARQAEDLALSRGDLEAQTSMLKLVLESMGEGLIAADREGHFLLWNDAANTLMGRGASDLPTEQWTPYYKVFQADGITPCPPDRLPLVRALNGEAVKVELMVQPPEPEPGKFIEVTARPLKDARGNPRGGVAVLHDITERKRSEADLAHQAEELRRSRIALESQAVMLQTVLDSMVEGLVAADQDGKFILWNPAAEKIMGLGPTNLPSKEWSAHYRLFLSDTVTPIPPGETPLERTLRGEAVNTEIFLRQAGVNTGLWLETNGSPLIDKNGVRRGGVLAFRDITRRKTDELVILNLNEELEERIAKRTEQLEATNHELEAFSYSVSHDLRAPLRHIAGFARILVNDFGPVMAVEAREHLQRIEDAVSRMGQLIDALLKMAVLRRQSLRLGRSELDPIVDDVISMLKPECDGRDVEWRIAKLPALDCDPILMAQVFQNLLGNALKYSRGRAKAVIEVDSIQRPDQPAIIYVRDNGAGFNMKYAERLFGVFQRFHTDSEFEGTGVGLATVQRIIQKHGGMIWAESEPDHGATFYFALQTTEQIGTMPKAAS